MNHYKQLLLAWAVSPGIMLFICTTNFCAAEKKLTSATATTQAHQIIQEIRTNRFTPELENRVINFIGRLKADGFSKLADNVRGVLAEKTPPPLPPRESKEIGDLQRQVDRLTAQNHDLVGQIEDFTKQHTAYDKNLNAERTETETLRVELLNKNNELAQLHSQNEQNVKLLNELKKASPAEAEKLALNRLEKQRIEFEQELAKQKKQIEDYCRQEIATIIEKKDKEIKELTKERHTRPVPPPKPEHLRPHPSSGVESETQPSKIKKVHGFKLPSYETGPLSEKDTNSRYEQIAELIAGAERPHMSQEEITDNAERAAGQVEALIKRGISVEEIKTGIKVKLDVILNEKKIKLSDNNPVVQAIENEYLRAELNA